MREVSKPSPEGLTGESAKPRMSLRNRVIVSFACFGLALSVLFTVVMWAALHIAEDAIIKRYLVLELESFLHGLSEGEIPLPSTRWLHATYDPEALPDVIQSQAGREDGVYELRAIAAGTEPFLLIHTLEDGRRLFLHLDAEEIEVIDTSLALLGLMLLVSCLLVTGIGVGLGRLTARKAIAPVVELAERVRRFDINRGDVFPASGLGDDEVALLAGALAESTERSQTFLQRERRFTRDASHELRSPVTVIRGAVELLDALPETESKLVRRPLERIRRATGDIERLIEAFLWLAREEELATASRRCRLSTEAGQAVERHRHLLDGKRVEVIDELDPEAYVEAPDGLLDIVLGNLIANACFFTQEGKILLRGDAHHFAVIDSGPGIPPDLQTSALEAHTRGQASHGFGLGLAIVRDLCERLGWRFELDGAAGSGTRAAVLFKTRH